MIHYLDTSALVKLVVAERETNALRAWLADRETSVVSSDLARTELLRAVRRTHPDRAPRARTVLDSIDLLKLATEDYDAAGRIGSDDLRSLDAIHLVAALKLGDDLESLVTYDRRLADAAQSNGITVLAPA